jgi:hypothetical protein
MHIVIRAFFHAYRHTYVVGRRNFNRCSADLRKRLKRRTKTFSLSKDHVMNACTGDEGKASHLPDFDTRLRWVISFMLWPLYCRGKRTDCWLDRRLLDPEGIWTWWRRETSWCSLEPIFVGVTRRSAKLLLTLASTVIPSFRSDRNPLPEFLFS